MDILQVFFENPNKDFQIRGIAKALHIPKTTVAYHITSLVKKKLVIKQEKGVFPSFRANEANEMFTFYKGQYFLEKIITCGLVDYLDAELAPKCIILFGSFAKAEYDRDSDIDIFIQSKEEEVNLRKFEKRLGHTINILFEPDIGKLSPELLNNIVNGIKLRGIIKIR